MLLFCPNCSNVLTVSPVPATISSADPSSESAGLNRLECNTCPYQYVITKRYFERKVFEKKEREDVFGGPGAWDNAQKAEVQCPTQGCDGLEAAFFQVQIRSADEPMTSFYKVHLPAGWHDRVNGRTWRDYLNERMLTVHSA